MPNSQISALPPDVVADLHAFATKMAEEDAAAVAHYLSAIGAGPDPTSGQPVRYFPAAFLLGLGLLLRLKARTSGGFVLKNDHGIKQIEILSQALGSLPAAEGESTNTIMAVWRSAQRAILECHAWNAPREFGCILALDEFDEFDDDMLVEQLAQFLWANRNQIM